MEIKKELNYPIKYAIMPIEEQTGWCPGLNASERIYEIVAYMVLKCYVIEERKEYLRDGTTKVKYEVVFLYTKKDSYNKDEFQPATPKYSFYSKCINSTFVSQLFDNFEDALQLANQLNDAIIQKEIGCLPFDDNFKANVETLKSKHLETLKKYKIIEASLAEKSIKIPISNRQKLEELIDRILENPSDFYIKLANTLSPEERDLLTKMIENRSCRNCTNASCDVEHCEKVELDETGKPHGSNCLNWNNSELIGRQLIMQKNNKSHL